MVPAFFSTAAKSLLGRCHYTSELPVRKTNCVDILCIIVGNYAAHDSGRDFRLVRVQVGCQPQSWQLHPVPWQSTRIHRPNIASFTVLLTASISFSHSPSLSLCACLALCFWQCQSLLDCLSVAHCDTSADLSIRETSGAGGSFMSNAAPAAQQKQRQFWKQRV